MWIHSNNWRAVVKRNQDFYKDARVHVIVGMDGDDTFIWCASSSEWVYDSEEAAKQVASDLKFDHMAIAIKRLEDL